MFALPTAIYTHGPALIHLSISNIKDGVKEVRFRQGSLYLPLHIHGDYVTIPYSVVIL